MRRTPLLVAALALPALLVGVAHAVEGGPRPARLVTADEPGSTTTSTTVDPTTTTVVTPPDESTTTTTEPESSTTTTSTTEPRPKESTTTTTAPPAEPKELTIGCVSDGGDPTVSCHWDGVPKRATRLVIMREKPGTPSQPLASTNDTSQRDFDDTTAELGVTYVYRVSAYDGDTFLETSNPERIKAGGGTPDAPPQVASMSLSCTVTGPSTVHCAWGQGPVTTVGYRLLRPIDDRRGRVVAQTGPTTFEATEQNVPAGTWHYIVQALDGSGHVLASGTAEVDCCTASADQR